MWRCRENRAWALICVISSETRALVASLALGDLLVLSGGSAPSAGFEAGCPHRQVCSGQSLCTAAVPVELLIHSVPFPFSCVPVWLRTSVATLFYAMFDSDDSFFLRSEPSVYPWGMVGKCLPLASRQTGEK